MIRKLALLLLFPLALACVAAMRILTRFGYVVRFGELFSTRIGHFVGNLDCYLSERAAGLHPRGLDLWVHQRAEPCNKALAKIIERTVTMGPAPLVRLVSLTNCMFDGWQKHIINSVQLDRDIYNLGEQRPPHFSLTAAEEKEGEETLRKWGVPAGAKWVCLIVRDGAYLPTLDYHAYRDTDIDSYRDAALALAERGYYVFRMGAKVAKPFAVGHARVIDYATNGWRSDFMDVYLGARCAFCVTTGTGLDAVPAAFRRPMCFVNYAPFEYLPTWFKGSLAIWKHHEKDGKRMTVAEIVKSDAGHFMQAIDYEHAGIKLVDNTPKEIREAVLEMASWCETPASMEYIAYPQLADQKAFWDAYPKRLSKYNQKPLHGEIRMRVGSAFLRNYAGELTAASGGVSKESECTGASA